MLIIPAIDIIEGKCVRLTRGDYNLKKKYHDNPVEIAEIWKNQGATWLHGVDLDGAKAGVVRNLKIAQEIKKKLDLKVQYGGGIRDIDTLKSVIESGIDRAVLGTKVIEDKNFLNVVLKQYWGKAILSLDYDRSGTIYKNGWQKQTAVNVLGFEKEGISGVIIGKALYEGIIKLDEAIKTGT